MKILIVNGEKHLVTDPYRDGARAWRNGKREFTNPYPLSACQHREWLAGFENDRAMRHVCDGVDVITSVTSPTGTCVASEIDPGSLKQVSRYECELMKSSGLLADAEQYIARVGVPYAKVLAEYLRGRGHSVHTDFAQKVILRALLDKEMQGAPLASHEIEKVEALTDIRVNFMLNLGRLQEDYYATKISHKALASACRKLPMWPGQILRTMRRDYLDFLVITALHHCRPSPKGWTAIQLLKERIHQPRQDLVA